MIPETKIITVRHWGICNDSGFRAPSNLVAFIRELEFAMQEIPAEYRESAEVDVSPDYEHGEHYEAVRITYERPMTADERAEWIREERSFLEGQIADSERWIAGKREELAAISPT